MLISGGKHIDTFKSGGKRNSISPPFETISIKESSEHHYEKSAINSRIQRIWVLAVDLNNWKIAPVFKCIQYSQNTAYAHNGPPN